MEEHTDGSITRLLARSEDGDSAASNELYARVYAELHRRAKLAVNGKQNGHSLLPTDIVHEAYLRLVGGCWQSREHFFAFAARAMRSVVIDHVRAKRCEKRSAPGERLAIDEIVEHIETKCKTGDLLDLHSKLEELKGFAPEDAQLVELHVFGGLTIPDVAKTMGRPLRSTEREWQTIKTWLYKELE